MFRKSSEFRSEFRLLESSKVPIRSPELDRNFKVPIGIPGSSEVPELKKWCRNTDLTTKVWHRI